MKKFLLADTPYALTSSDQQIILEMAAIVYQQDRSYWNQFRVDKSKHSFTLFVNSFGAEMAFCRLCDTTFDNSTSPKISHFLRPDTVLKNKLKVDVKSSTNEHSALFVSKNKASFKVDIYALLTGTFPNYVFRGFSSYNKLIQQKNYTELNGINAYFMTQFCLEKKLAICL